MAGATGAVGPQGTQGSQGTIGVQGLQGTQGSQGATGPPGGTAPGPTGPTGPQGSQGSQGSIGIQGNQGTQGSAGAGGSTKPFWELNLGKTVNGTMVTYNNHRVLDAANAVNIYAETVLPTAYAGGGLTFDIYFAIATDTDAGHNATWNIELMRHQADTDDLDTDSYVAANASSAFAPLTSANLTRKRTITFTDGADMDSIAAGESFTVKLYHSGSVSGEVHIIQVIARET